MTSVDRECFLCGEAVGRLRRCTDIAACDARTAKQLARAKLGLAAGDIARAARKREGFK